MEPTYVITLLLCLMTGPEDVNPDCARVTFPQTYTVQAHCQFVAEYLTATLSQPAPFKGVAECAQRQDA